MISDVSVGLAQLFGDLVERIAFEEMQPQRLPLLLGQRLQNLPPGIPAEEPFDCGVVFCPQTCPWISFQRPVRNPGRAEAVRLQFPPAKERLCIRNLEYPRAR